MIQLQRTTSDHPSFRKLIVKLDVYLAEINGESHDFFQQHNTLEQIRHVLIAAYENESAGCGAMREFDRETMEIKRMYVLPEFRRKGIASQLVVALEAWAVEMGYRRCILETSVLMEDAVKTYCSLGYQPISNYGPYLDVESSRCFEKILI